jgi:hypothetical protein
MWWQRTSTTTPKTTQRPVWEVRTTTTASGNYWAQRYVLEDSNGAGMYESVTFLQITHLYT